MTTKHTPGTWRFAPELSAVVVIRDHKVKAVADFGKNDLPECEANGRLIAAAPDLLQALEIALTALDCDVENGPLPPVSLRAAQNWMRAKFGESARAAIAKARGEA